MCMAVTDENWFTWSNAQTHPFATPDIERVWASQFVLKIMSSDNKNIESDDIYCVVVEINCPTKVPLATLVTEDVYGMSGLM